MSTTTRNEAAERLHEWIYENGDPDGEASAWVREALAAERRATVERMVDLTSQFIEQGLHALDAHHKAARTILHEEPNPFPTREQVHLDPDTDAVDAFIGGFKNGWYAALAATQPEPSGEGLRFDHGGTYRHHHDADTEEPVWWSNCEQFGGEKRHHLHKHGRAATPSPERQEQEADAFYKGGRWHRRSVELLSLLSDAVMVQRHPCDHDGIGKPGCVTCDPRIRDNLGIGQQAAALSQPEQPKGEPQA